MFLLNYFQIIYALILHFSSKSTVDTAFEGLGATSTLFTCDASNPHVSNWVSGSAFDLGHSDMTASLTFPIIPWVHFVTISHLSCGLY